MRIPAKWQDALTNGRLLLLSFFDDNVRRTTAALSALRNTYLATLANQMLVLHAEMGSKTEKLCKDFLTQDKPVFALDSPDNSHLLELGAVPVSTSSECINGLIWSV